MTPTHGLGLLTLALGNAAAADAVATAAEAQLPVWAFRVFGGPKLPLQLVWTIAIGSLLVRRSVSTVIAQDDAQ